MRIEQTTPHHPIQRLYYLGIFTLLVAVAVLAAGCNPATKTADEHVKPAQPMPTPPPDDTLGDTPIVISGGSIHLDFNNRMFKLCTQAPPTPCPPMNPPTNTGYWAKGTATKALIYDDNESSGDNPVEVMIPAGKSFRIMGKQGAANVGDIVITNVVNAADPTMNIVAIQFPESGVEGQLKFRRRNANSPRRTSKKLKIVGVALVNNPADPGTPLPGLPPGNKMTIEIH
jgi:hypothetical protein